MVTKASAATACVILGHDWAKPIESGNPSCHPEVPTDVYFCTCRRCGHLIVPYISEETIEVMLRIDANGLWAPR